jgi:hypothetical protein
MRFRSVQTVNGHLSWVLDGTRINDLAQVHSAVGSVQPYCSSCSGVDDGDAAADGDDEAGGVVCTADDDDADAVGSGSTVWAGCVDVMMMTKMLVVMVVESLLPPPPSPSHCRCFLRSIPRQTRGRPVVPVVPLTTRVVASAGPSPRPLPHLLIAPTHRSYSSLLLIAPPVLIAPTRRSYASFLLIVPTHRSYS